MFFNDLNTTNGEFVLITQVNDQCSVEFSSSLSKMHLNRNLDIRFPDFILRKEIGVLSKYCKQILYFNADSKNIINCQRIMQFTEFLQNNKVSAWYRQTPDALELLDWYIYAEKTFGKNLTPKACNYTLFKNSYGNVDALKGFPKGWHQTTLTTKQLEKLEIPYYKACIDFRESYSYAKPVLVNIIPDDFTKTEELYILEQERKNNEKLERIQKLELTPKLIAECLYSINKEAKRKRDIQNHAVESAYITGEKYPSVHYNLHRAKKEKEELYKLKNKAIHLAIKIWNLEPDGYHKFADGNRDMYTIEEYTFHINENKSQHCLGEIQQEITSERKRCIQPWRAILVLKRFVKELK